jgi:hypothetical protein
MYLISFIEHFFNLLFTINLMKLVHFFLVKKLTMLRDKIFLENCAFYGLDTEPEPEPELVKSRNQNRHCNLQKVGTGTVTNS